MPSAARRAVGDVPALTTYGGGRAETRVTDAISLTFPADERFRSVSTLVLGGVGTRLDLSYERMDDLQLALLSVLEAIDGEEASVDIAADEAELAVTIGPLRIGTGDDAGLLRVVERLVDGHDVKQRDGKEWLTVQLARPETQVA